MVNLQDIIKLIESKKKSSFPWERQKPYDQEYYTYSANSNTWQSSGSGHSLTAPKTTVPPPLSFRVLSWNIDFMLPYPNQRMQVALDHVHSLVGPSDSATAATEPSIIFFNEMLVSDLTLIQAQTWIQQGYSITDIDNRFWESGHYGTCTLVPKSLAISNVFRVHYEATKMERDALLVDVDIGNGRVVTFCNSHLESLVAQPPLRPEQVKTASKYLHRANLVGGVMGGDFNAIEPFDRSLHSNNGLKDAFLELGGKEDCDDAYTWGQMAPVHQRERFGCSRMDKLFFCGDIQVIDFQRFGYGVDVQQDSIRKVLMEDEGMDGGWVTDHLGVMASFKLRSIADDKATAETDGIRLKI
ncbi:hypothetical protein DV736_g2296, partial [Chaetothyriales sp. CBS 134916]